MEKQRKFLMVLPLLIIPFATMAFIALGGGKGNASTNTPAAKGFNTSLPQARFNSDQQQNKLQVYQQAPKDSNQNGVSAAFKQSMHDTAKVSTPVFAQNKADEQAMQIQSRLTQINRTINTPSTPQNYDQPDERQAREHIKQMQQMMRSMKSNQQEDPEMKQLSQMLTQIQAIQNPSKAKAETKPEATTPFHAIPAIIDGKQKVMDGGAVKLKLTDSVTLKNQLLPKGQEIFGVCSVTNQRLLLTIQNIRLDKQIIPVNLTVFSLDGMAGIPAPEAQISGAASSGADNAIQSMQFLTMDASLGAQAAAGGVNAAKGLFSKKVHQVKVKLKDEYPVLLKINK